MIDSLSLIVPLETSRVAVLVEKRPSLGPFNTYNTVVTAQGFGPYVLDTAVRSAVPVDLQISLTVGSAASTTIAVEGENDVVENESIFHTDVDQGILHRRHVEI